LLFLYKESIRQENQLSSSAIDFVSFQQIANKTNVMLDFGLQVSECFMGKRNHFPDIRLQWVAVG